VSGVPKVGAFVLETLTTGMYVRALDTLREFVQNSFDSIRRAEKEGILAKGEGRIEVFLDPSKRTLSVHDNGVGLSPDSAYAYLTNIGMSAKRIETDAGFRGIGRLGGIAYCQKLTFRTSVKGEATTSIIEMDCEALTQAISPAMRQVEELADVMGRCSSFRRESCQPHIHFFEVTMYGIKESVTDFLDWEIVEEYLCQVAPVEYDAQRFMFAPKILEWVEKHGLTLSTTTLVLKTPSVQRQVFKPYRNRYTTKIKSYPVEIKDVCFYPENPSPDTPFWLWYGKTDLLGVIDDERAAGLRFRKNNIEVGGPDRVADLFGKVASSNRRFNGYYIGEIHVLSSRVIPNARRDGFEDIEPWPSIKKSLMPFIRERCEEIRSLSEARNRPTAKVISSANSVIKNVSQQLKTGFSSRDEQKALINKVEKEEQKVTKALQTRSNSADCEKLHPVIDKLKQLRKALEQKDNFISSKVKSSLDRKQRKLLAEILQILYENLDESTYLRVKTIIHDRFK